MTTTPNCVSIESSTADVPDSLRCRFAFADGRRCRSPRCAADSPFCATHARARTEAEPSAGCRPRRVRAPLGVPPKDSQPARTHTLTLDLTPISGEFRTATDVNRALGKVFCLLAENRIPRRNAVALGYIAQLLLQTLPAVREELISGLGYQVWRETLDSALCEQEDETEDDSPNSEDQTDRTKSGECLAYKQVLQNEHLCESPC
jgi:hypothetical protein